MYTCSFVHVCMCLYMCAYMCAVHVGMHLHVSACMDMCAHVWKALGSNHTGIGEQDLSLHKARHPRREALSLKGRVGSLI